ncbi:MAG: 50S ribosomal protein L32e [Candidatus Odinarchaeia archaeon]
MSEIKRLLKIKERIKQKLPKFIRQESWRYKRIKEAWRRPKGIDNKVRKKRKGFIKMPDIGYRTPKVLRGLHPSGKKEILVNNMQILEKYNPEEYLVRLSSRLGLRKKNLIIEKAEELGFQIINAPLIQREEPEKWEKLDELEMEEIEPEAEEEYVKQLEEEGSLEGLPEFELDEEKSKAEKKSKAKKKKTKKEDKSK